MLTPLDIENKKFSRKRISGYSVEEVDEFLDEVTVDYEKLYKENSELKDKIVFRRKCKTLQINRRYASKHIGYGTINCRWN